MKSTRLLIMTAGGTGLLKPGSGTWGSVPVVVLAMLLGLSGSPGLIQWVMAAIVLMSSWACVAMGRWAEERFGGKDPGAVVIDEVAGQALTLLLLPWPSLMTGMGPVVIACLVGFGAFRLFDIWKPRPISQLQSLPAGWGVLMDDLLAAIPAAILTWAVLWIAGFLETASI